MRDSVGKILESADLLMRERQYARAIDALAEIDYGSISPDEKAAVDLTRIEAQLHLGRYDMRELLEHTLEYLRTGNSIALYGKAKFLQGWLHVSQGSSLDAKEALLESYVHFKRADDIRGQARALEQLSSLAYQAGELQPAATHLMKAQDLYRQLGDERNGRIITQSLARIYRAAGRLDESIATYARIHPNPEDETAGNMAAYYMMYAVPHALKHDFIIAHEMLDKAGPYIDDMTPQKAAHFAHLGWVHNLEGNHEMALNALRQGMDILRETAPESSGMMQIRRHMADAHLALGDHAAARKYADEALAVAETLNDRVEIASCHRIYAQLDAAAGNAAASRVWFGKAVDMFSEIGAQYELATTRRVAAKTGIYSGGERQALLYLAREYFQREEISRIVEMIDAESAATTQSRTQPRRRTSGVPTIIHRSAAMKRLVELAEHIAPSDMSVLLTGATGAGKDLFARYIHHFSGRSGRFVSVNAAAIPNDMVESELFGYRRGAYTGAATTTAGWIEEAEGGTFYLNEIADSSPELQAKLLDVIEHRRICRLGDRQERQIDCRFIAATNHRLEELIDDGLFRLDLFHRLNEIPIHLPPLSERREDIEPLLEYFLKAAGVEIATESDRAAFDNLVKIFNVRPWQGNVRQMESEVRRLALIHRGDIPSMVDAAGTYRMSTKEETLAALQRTGWNRREVGRILGISESTVRHRIKVYKLTEE